MLLNAQDLEWGKTGVIELKAVCHACDKEVQLQLSHYHENELLVLPHRCEKETK